jgi:hypothetical protein
MTVYVEFTDADFIFEIANGTPHEVSKTLADAMRAGATIRVQIDDAPSFVVLNVGQCRSVIVSAEDLADAGGQLRVPVDRLSDLF